MNEMKTIVLCADDFGLNPGVSQGILKLVQLHRLSAVSCMVNVPDFVPYAQELLALESQVQIGLHFNLTEGYFSSDPDRRCFGLNELLIKAHLGLISPTFIAKEFNIQLDQFIQVIGYLPDFIDGHQHVHQFPRIRQVILRLYDERLRCHKTSIRSTYPTMTWPAYRIKTKILALTGGRALHSQLHALSIPHNSYFSGVYDFKPGTNYRALFKQWLNLAPSHTLVMCHPGELGSSADPIACSRLMELDYFLSDDFVFDCQEHRIHIL